MCEYIVPKITPLLYVNIWCKNYKNFWQIWVKKLLQQKKKILSILEDWNVYCLHCIKQSSFLLKISIVNVTKSAGSTRFDHIYWRNPLWKFPFLCSVNDTSSFAHNLFPYKKPRLLFRDFQISESPSTGEITA